MAINPSLIKPYTKIHLLSVKIKQLGIQHLPFNCLVSLVALKSFPMHTFLRQEAL